MTKIIDSKIPEGPVAEKWTNYCLLYTSYTDRFNPFVYLFLCFVYSHIFLFYSLFLVSMQMVTGPWFNRSTFISAPNSPVCTGLPSASPNFRQKLS